MRRMRTGRDAALIPAPQDDLCLAFANTLSWRGSPAPSESLGGIDDLLGWLANTAKIPPQTIEAVGKRLRRQSSEAAKLFSEAIELREAIYRACSARLRFDRFPRVSAGPLRDQQEASNNENGDDRRRDRPAQRKAAGAHRLVEEVADCGPERPRQDERCPKKDDARHIGRGI